MKKSAKKKLSKLQSRKKKIAGSRNSSVMVTTYQGPNHAYTEATKRLKKANDEEDKQLELVEEATDVLQKAWLESSKLDWWREAKRVLRSSIYNISRDASESHKRAKEALLNSNIEELLKELYEEKEISPETRDEIIYTVIPMEDDGVKTVRDLLEALEIIDKKQLLEWGFPEGHTDKLLEYLTDHLYLVKNYR